MTIEALVSSIGVAPPGIGERWLTAVVGGRLPVDPALLVALPLVGSVAPAVLSTVRDRLGWPLAAAILLAQTSLALALAGRALAGDEAVTDVGAIPPPFGIRLTVDALSAPFVALVAVSALVILAYTRRDGPRSGPVYSLYLLLVAGLTGVCLTRDIFNLYVFLEISGLASYALVASARSGRAAHAALKYLLLGTVGASLYLFGVGFAYVATGTLSMTALSAAVASAPPPLVLASFALVTAGLGVKIALYPVHTWKPDAYATAPTGVTALLAALASTVAAYALARILLSAFTVDFLLGVPGIEGLLRGWAGVSIVAGSLLAFRSRTVKRLLAYSSIAQFGVVLVGLSVATPTGVTGAVVHLLGHAAMKSGAFLAVGVVGATCGAETIDEYAGLASRAPLTSAALAVLTLGLVGFPPTVGFVGKLYVALGAVEADAWAAAGLVFLSTLFSLAYFGRLVERMYLGASSIDGGTPGDERDTDPTGGGTPAAGRDDGDSTTGRAGTPADTDEIAAFGTVSAGMYAAVLVAVIATLGLGLAVPSIERSLAPLLGVLL
jgi:multicomponent Na+:H+ antiporter subunit D